MPIASVFETRDCGVGVKFISTSDEPRAPGLTEDEVRERISTLPAVFSPVGLDYIADRLEAAREAGAFDFKIFEYRGRK